MTKELFKNIPSKVGDLVRGVESGRIGLPDLQRPFVWQDSKVRELFDSMLRGYPIGYIMLWESPANYESKKNSIGSNDKTYVEAKELVIDGQQRLTALVASMYGVKIVDKNFAEHEIRISFNPLTREFAVFTSALEKAPEWISKVSDVFLAKENNTISTLRRRYIRELNESREKKDMDRLTDAEEDLIENNINALLNLTDYSLPTLEISYDAPEEDVADIFVRVNSGGQSLNENNFIQTLISVYENSTNDRINQFCKESRIPRDGTSYNNILAVEPSHLIRMAVGLGFRRARLRYAYMLLRGKDLDTGKYSSEERQKNLDTFKAALEKVMNLNNWHSFLNIIGEAGYINKNQISAKNAEELITYLEETISARFSDDYFNITLPNELNSASANSPAWNAYIASQIVLNTPMLFSTSQLAKYFVPGASGSKNAIDKHHIFPKHYLTQLGYTTDRDRNQIANYTYLDYATNIDISDNAPEFYVAKYRNKLGEDDYKKSCAEHALPINFAELDYMEFLRQRRILMAKVIKQAYLKLCQQ